MRKYLSFAFLFIASFSFAQNRLLTYNIRNAKGMDNQTDYDRIAAAIKTANADVVALQELDSATTRSKGEYVLELIAKRTDYKFVFAAAISYQNGKYGVGLLSKKKPLRFYSVALPGKEEKRVLLVAEFKKCVVFCTHFSLTEADRKTSVDIVNAEAAKFSKPIYLLGDLNAEPKSESIQELKRSWTLLSGEAFSFPADKPNRCIDYIFCKNCKIGSFQTATVLDEPMASDHRPVLVSK